MIRSLRALSVSVCLSLASAPLAFAAPSPGAAKPAADEKCPQHGVKKPLCTRCNPKLKAIFKAKNDWCAEHERPESQCVICHPALAKEGVK